MVVFRARPARGAIVIHGSDIAKLRSDLERFMNLRAGIADPRTRLILSEILAEIRASLRRLENPERGSPGNSEG
jgi:hypothetical protein